jgi:spermidine synthase
LYRTQLWLVPAFAGALLLAPHVLKHFDLEMKPWMLAIHWLIAGIALLLIALWLFFHSLGTRWRVRFLNEGVVGAALLALSVFLTGHVRAQQQEAVYHSRNFYGTLAVNEQELNENTRYFELVHGRIVHGTQLVTRASLRYTPTTYYNESSGAGLILRHHPQHTVGPLRVGAVGLGTGTLSAYARMGDVFRFYEINPAVIRLAQSEPHPWFDYVPHARSLGAEIDIVRGDARLSLERELREGRPGRYDVLLVDAFNGDSIPIHLLTVEAMQLYLQHLRDEKSVIALHISNRNVDLKTVAAGLAERLNLHAIWIRSEDTENLNLQSDWVLLSRSNAVLRIPEIRNAGLGFLSKKDLLVPPPPPPVWTDDFSNVWQVLEMKDDDASAH